MLAGALHGRYVHMLHSYASCKSGCIGSAVVANMGCIVLHDTTAMTDAHVCTPEPQVYLW